jgi:hypothetical protein
MTLKPYYQLDCPDDLQKTISEKTIDYLKSKYIVITSIEKQNNKMNLLESEYSGKFSGLVLNENNSNKYITNKYMTNIDEKRDLYINYNNLVSEYNNKINVFSSNNISENNSLSTDKLIIYEVIGIKNRNLNYIVGILDITSKIKYGFYNDKMLYLFKPTNKKNCNFYIYKQYFFYINNFNGCPRNHQFNAFFCRKSTFTNKRQSY